ncbi:MAG TPA: hypothetical protein VEI98_13165 [Xanthobacteraceae bacterium]|nr:hypothetical protein [Xanthobacteraceae bacterium]
MSTDIHMAAEKRTRHTAVSIGVGGKASMKPLNNAIAAFWSVARLMGGLIALYSCNDGWAHRLNRGDLREATGATAQS